MAPQTKNNWINEYKPICTYHKLRNKAKKLFNPEEIIEKHEFLHNNLPYKFQIHKAKLELLFKDKLYNNEFINQSKYYEPIKKYLEKIPTKQFPHHIFRRYKKDGGCPSAEIEKNNNLTLNKNNYAISASEQPDRTKSASGEENKTRATNLASSDAVIAKNNLIENK